MSKAKPITQAGRARVTAALNRHGMLLVQGQWEIPSLADLLEGAPVTTRGYSWDYVPAWELSAELAARPDVATAKLLRGRTTLIDEQLWPAVDALARDARLRIEGVPARLLRLVESHPGIPGGELRRLLKLDARGFQRVKGLLEQRLCLFGEERKDLDHHTHESAWYPWSASKIARGHRTGVEPDAAVRTLMAAVFPDGGPPRAPRPSTLFPALRGRSPSGRARTHGPW